LLSIIVSFGMPPRRPVECFCTMSEDEGEMVRCRKCKKWQHSECVNINRFREDAQYECPRCRGLELDCTCGYEGDYRSALAFCAKCGMHQHKRHVELGLGVIPPGYQCKKCRTGANPVSKARLDVAAVARCLPWVPAETGVRPVADCPRRVPPGRFANFLAGLSGPAAPLDVISDLYQQFRDVIFKAHPFLRFFKYLDFKPREFVDETLSFLYYFAECVAFMLELSTHDVVAILNHVIAVDVYGLPVATLSYAAHPLLQVSAHRRHTEFTERARFQVGKRSVHAMTDSFELPRLALAPDGAGAETVVCLSNVKNGALLCEVYGEVSVFEELDRDSQVPRLSLLSVTGTQLIVDIERRENDAIQTRVRRGVYYNCEARLFRLNGKMRVGLFATIPALLPTLFDALRKASVIAIHAGDELFAPFDVPPVIEQFGGDWRTHRGRKPAMDMEIFKPTPPPVVREARAGQDRRGAGTPEQQAAPGTGSLVAFFGEAEPFCFSLKPDEAERPPRRAQLPQFISRVGIRGQGPVARPDVVREPIPQFWFAAIPDPNPVYGEVPRS